MNKEDEGVRGRACEKTKPAWQGEGKLEGKGQNECRRTLPFMHLSFPFPSLSEACHIGQKILNSRLSWDKQLSNFACYDQVFYFFFHLGYIPGSGSVIQDHSDHSS